MYQKLAPEKRSRFMALISGACVVGISAMGWYLPYGFTQCYLSPDTSEHTQP